jgi:hypothetical protein
MHNIVGLTANPNPANRYKTSAARIVVGYGNYNDGTVATGQLIMTKQRAGIDQSNQVDVVRTSARAGTCFPV